MKPGTPVFIARLVDGEVRLERERVVRPGKYGTEVESGCVPTADLHATASAALLALEEQLREKAVEARKHAADLVLRGERLDALAAEARRKAETER